jgi:hypothetical protein
MGILLIAEKCEAALDDGLGLGTWHEHSWIDHQGEPAKAPLAQHVGERLSSFPSLEQAFEATKLRVDELAAQVHSECRPRRPENVSEEELCVDDRCLAAGVAKPTVGFRQQCADLSPS